MREVKIFLKGQAKENYFNLKRRNDKESISILNSINRTFDKLKQNPQAGQPLAKKLVPEEIKRLGVTNLYRIELSNYWRMIYAIEGDKIAVYLFVLKIFDHKEYNKFFGYK